MGTGGKLRRVLSALAVLAGLFSLPAEARADLTVFAAASLKGPLDRVAGQWSEATGEVVRVAYAGSATLARQIDQGAEADVVILANADWLNWLTDRGALVGGWQGVLSNDLVLVGHGAGRLPEDEIAAMLVPEAVSDGIAVALTDAVPAGIYARQSLEALGLWAGLRPNLIETDNVRAALALVARGEVPLGVVYASDALREPAVSVLHTFDSALHDPIIYGAAVTREADPLAARFVGHLMAPPAQEVLLSAGFKSGADLR